MFSLDYSASLTAPEHGIVAEFSVPGTNFADVLEPDSFTGKTEKEQLRSRNPEV